MGNISSKTKKNPKDDPFFTKGDSYIERSQGQHDLIRALWNSNFSAPVHEILKVGDGNVLDLCCGSGTWVCDNSSDFRHSRFWGIDVLQHYPTQKPLNVEFIKADVLQGIPFDTFFDFVHLRYVGLWFTEDQIKQIILPECLRVLRPGGWLEICDVDYRFYNAKKTVTELEQILHKQMHSRNLNPLLTNNLKKILTDMGSFENIQEEVKMLPMGNKQSKLGDIGGKLVFGTLLKINVDLRAIREKQAAKTLEQAIQESNLNNTYIKSRRIFAQKIIKQE